MSGPIPTLGYPTRTAAVLALRAQGLTTGAIARRIGIEPATVSALECSARRSPEAPRAQFERPVVFPVGLLQRLGPAAARRGMTRERLAILIVETVVEDGMIDAVLDDGPEDGE